MYRGFTVLKTQIYVTRPQCVNRGNFFFTSPTTMSVPQVFSYWHILCTLISDGINGIFTCNWPAKWCEVSDRLVGAGTRPSLTATPDSFTCLLFVIVNRIVLTRTQSQALERDRAVSLADISHCASQPKYLTYCPVLSNMAGALWGKCYTNCIVYQVYVSRFDDTGWSVYCLIIWIK